jgi:hypothetical protein
MCDDTPLVDMTVRLPLPLWEAVTEICRLRKKARDAVVQEAIEDLVKAWVIASELAVLGWRTPPPTPPDRSTEPEA